MRRNDILRPAVTAEDCERYQFQCRARAINRPAASATVAHAR